ncbi:hypothetical protein Bbelb_420920 [Branchiostoma belcheri]|nr:hypothetical protein Bbelb_420920 [Branchiostoma belcheri]
MFARPCLQTSTNYSRGDDIMARARGGHLEKKHGGRVRTAVGKDNKIRLGDLALKALSEAPSSCTGPPALRHRPNWLVGCQFALRQSKHVGRIIKRSECACRHRKFYLACNGTTGGRRREHSGTDCTVRPKNMGKIA